MCPKPYSIYLKGDYNRSTKKTDETRIGPRGGFRLRASRPCKGGEPPTAGDGFGGFRV